MVAVAVKAYNYIQSFSCLAEYCEDTCCSGMTISISPRHIDFYTNEFPELLDLIVKESDQYHLRKDKDDQCVALQAGRCAIQETRGDLALPDTCAIYPRAYRRITDFHVKAATMSCPEVARLALFGNTPFNLKDLNEEDHIISECVSGEFPGLEAESWVTITNLFHQLVQADDCPAEEVIARLYDLVTGLADISYTHWVEGFARLTLDYRPPTSSQEPIITDSVLLVLIDILKTPYVPETLLQRVKASIYINLEKTFKQNRLALKPQFRKMAKGNAGTVLEPILKRFISAEMTRTGFPFISTTKTGQDYGLTLTEWAASLSIRTLALRYLLLAHCDEAESPPITQQKIVDLVYRYCRATTHHVATKSELALRLRISKMGAPYLFGLIKQI